VVKGDLNAFGEIPFRRSGQGILESFWNYAKRRLVKFYGVPQQTFFLHFKETEFRFNHRSKNLYKVLLNMLRKKPLNYVLLPKPLKK